MCQHVKNIVLKRNAIVSLRDSLEIDWYSPLNKQFSRHENYYESLIGQWESHCPVCYDIVYAPPEMWGEVEAKWEDIVCKEVLTWLKYVDHIKTQPKEAINE